MLTISFFIWIDNLYVTSVGLSLYWNGPFRIDCNFLDFAFCITKFGIKTNVSIVKFVAGVNREFVWEWRFCLYNNLFWLFFDKFHGCVCKCVFANVCFDKFFDKFLVVFANVCLQLFCKCEMGWVSYLVVNRVLLNRMFGILKFGFFLNGCLFFVLYIFVWVVFVVYCFWSMMNMVLV